MYLARGRGFYWIEGNAVSAEADFRKALELSKGLTVLAWQGLGDALSRQGKKTEAILAYEKYLAMRPKSEAHHDAQIKKAIAVLRSQP